MTRTTMGRHRRASQEASQDASASQEPPADAELLAAVRAGDTDAFETLYERHAEAARRLALVMVRDPSDAEDLVAEAVAKVLAALRLGKGPELAFRAYLLTAVRNACYDRARRDRRLELTEDITKYERAEAQPPGGDPAVTRLERSYAARAFAKLPERWQMVLWHTEVEGEKPATIAPMLGLSPNAVAALAYRARERLKQIYLQEHLANTEDPSHQWTAGRLGAYVRHGLPRRERSKVDAHLAGCEDCRALWVELAEVNSGLRGVLAPVVLGAAATPYLATVPSAAWWAGIMEAVRNGWSIVDAWVRGLVRRHGSTNLAAGAGIAAAALVGVLLFALALVLGPEPDQPQPPRPPIAAEPQPVPVPVPAPPTPTSSPPAEPGSPPEPPPAEQPVDVPAVQPPPSTPAPGTGDRPPAPVTVAPDLSATSLAAGDQGALAIAVRLPESAPAESIVTAGFDRETAAPDDPATTSPEASPSAPATENPAPTASPESTTDPGAVLTVGWPAGITLAGPDAGDGWRCAALEDPTGTGGAVCRRDRWRPGETTTARLPVTVDQSLGGFAPVTVTIEADGRRGEASFRVPVTPVGFEVGFAATGRYELAMAGNTWLSCPARPACLRGDRIDNNLVRLRPYLPGERDPAPPPGLSRAAVAASGAELAIPAGAEVAWAALHWATTASGGPDLVQLHGPTGDWHQVTPDAIRHAGGGRSLRQAYADVTDLVRSALSGAGARGTGGGDGLGAGGAWWAAAGGGPLPAGERRSAGWSLTVMWDEPAAPARDVAVFAGPVSLSGTQRLSVTAATTDGNVEAGLVIWEGDRTLTGDGLGLDRQPLGEPDNVAASRAIGALECGGEPAGSCGWHTFGVDVGQYQGTAGGGGAVTLHTGEDLVEVGVLVLSVESPR